MDKVFTNREHAAWLRRQAELKRPYWYGVYHLPCTEALLEKKKRQYPAHYTDKRMARYLEDVAAGQIAGDCVNGAIKGAVWSELDGREPVYKSHGCPDRSADGMFAFCREQGMDWGAMDSMPDEMGVAVRMSGHVGVYVGDGEVVEWRGFAHGCVITRLDGRKWTHWYRLPWTEYVPEEEKKEEISVGTLGGRLLRRGRKGGDVRTLQLILMQLGYDLPEYGADGEYGTETAAAVRAFQVMNGLMIDGIYGAKTHAALMGVLAEQEEDGEPEDMPRPARKVRVTGGTVFVRTGAGREYDVVTVVRRDMLLDWLATADNGWHAVRSGGMSGWIGPKYTEVMDA